MLPGLTFFDYFPLYLICLSIYISIYLPHYSRDMFSTRLEGCITLVSRTGRTGHDVTTLTSGRGAAVVGVVEELVGEHVVVSGRHCEGQYQLGGRTLLL